MAVILIIEDHQDMREMFKMLLEHMGHQVEVAREGVEGLHQLQRRPDLVLLDLSMPMASGDVVLGYIRSTPDLAHTKVLVISALPNADQISVQLGADACLKKPADLSDVRKLVNQLLDEARA